MSERVVRALLLGAGVLAVALGLRLGVGAVPVSQWWPVARWLAGGVVLHDAVLAPVAVVMGVVVLRRVPVAVRSALRVALLGAGSFGFLLVCVVAGSGTRRNPTVLPQTLASAVSAAAVAVLLAAALTAAFEYRRGGRLDGSRLRDVRPVTGARGGPGPGRATPR